MELPLVLLTGVIAGLAVAAPLGAIGVLLVQEGLTRGLRRGLPAAGAVATVDTLYCVAAVIAGSILGPVITAAAPWPQILGGTTLLALGAHGLRNSWRSTAPGVANSVMPTARTKGRYALFLGLTAINPATLLYFAAILPGLNEAASSTPARIVFVVGVAVASFSWQALLVALGAGLRRKTGPSFQSWTRVIGNGTVAILGVALIAQAVSQVAGV